VFLAGLPCSIQERHCDIITITHRADVTRTEVVVYQGIGYVPVPSGRSCAIDPIT